MVKPLDWQALQRLLDGGQLLKLIRRTPAKLGGVEHGVGAPDQTLGVELDAEHKRGA